MTSRLQCQKGYTMPELLILLLLLFGVIGWVMNVCKLVFALDDSLSLMLLLRVIGVFIAPLGAILGYFP